jgi:hypothetical protein
MEAGTGMPSAELVTAISSGVVGLGSLAGTIAVARAGRRTPRQQRLDEFAVIQAEVRRSAADLKEELQAKVRELREEIGEERAGRAEDQRACAEERRENRRVINALARILRTTFRHMDALGIPDPVLDPGDVGMLEEYNVR